MCLRPLFYCWPDFTSASSYQHWAKAPIKQQTDNMDFPQKLKSPLPPIRQQLPTPPRHLIQANSRVSF